MNKISGIYMIKNKTSTKYYIGRSVNCNERFSKHKSLLRNGNHINNHLQNAWNLYGEDDFIFEIIDESENDKLPYLEDYWCRLLKTHNREYGYNIEPTNPCGKTCISLETIEKIRKANIGKKVSEETRNKIRISNLGKKLSISTIEKLKDNKKNIKIDAYNENGDFIKTFKSIREASRVLTIGVKNIRKCIYGQIQVTASHIFKLLSSIKSIKNGNNSSLIDCDSNNLNNFKCFIFKYILFMKYLKLFEELYQEENSYFTHDGNKYDINQVFNIIQDMEIQSKNVNIDKLDWVISHTDIDKNRVSKADINVPIIITKMKDGKLVILDGIHRLVKSKNDNKKSILSIEIPEEELEKCKIKNYNNFKILNKSIDSVKKFYTKADDKNIKYKSKDNKNGLSMDFKI